MRMWMSVAVGAVLMLLLGWGIWSRLQSGDAGKKGVGGRPGGRGGAVAVAVEIAPVSRGDIRDIRTFTGTLSPRSRFVVAPKIAGRLERLGVNVGDRVPAGGVLAVLEDEEYVQQVAQARATLDVAAATVEQQSTALNLARREMERIQTLREKKIASEAEWDTAEAEFKAKAALQKVAQAQMAEKASALKATEVRLSYTRIMAPQNMTIGAWFVDERYVDEGAMLASNTPIISVVDLESVTAVIQVIERDYPSIHVGLPVEISTDAFPGQVFSGQVKRIAPVLRESSRQARVEVEVPNAEKLLRPGMFVRARMEFSRHEQTMLVPRTAVVKRDGKPVVFLVNRSDATKLSAQQVFVTLGIESGDVVEVVAPELAGEVVTLGHHLLTDGSPLILPEAPDEKEVVAGKGGSSKSRSSAKSADGKATAEKALNTEKGRP